MANVAWRVERGSRVRVNGAMAGMSLSVTWNEIFGKLGGNGG